MSLATRVAIFRCLFIGHHANWKINEDDVEFGAAKEFDISTVKVDEAKNLRMSTLTVNISLSQNKHNNTNFLCVVTFRHIIFVYSDPAHLLIQGMN